MSILCSLSNGWLISHKDYIESVYAYTFDQSSGALCKVWYRDALFKIIKPYKSDHNLENTKDVFSQSSSTSENSEQHASGIPLSKKKKKRKLLSKVFSAELEELTLVNDMYLSHIEEAKKCGFFLNNVLCIDTQGNNDEARQLSDVFYLRSSQHSKQIFHGANNTDAPLISYNGKEEYIFPLHSSFFCYNVDAIDAHMNQLETSYDLVLLDPPWWNKYIRRKKSKCSDGAYEMMPNEDLAKIPVGALLAPGALVAVWCTNSANHINSLQNEIFPSWGVTYIGMWYWLKVTLFGELVCPFTDPRGKQPFERIIFGYRHVENRTVPLPDNGKMIISVPSAIHSHKPPLSDVLSAYLPAQPRCLELFARYLMPEWTSWGNEVLKLQHLSLYEKQPVTNPVVSVQPELPV